VLAAVPDGVELQVELKGDRSAADVREAVRAADCEVSVSSFDEAAIRKIVDLGWDVSTGLLFESDPVEKLQTAVELGCDAVHPYYDVCLETDVVEAGPRGRPGRRRLEAARRRTEIHVLRSLGVDGVTADRWEIAQRARVGPSKPASIPFLFRSSTQCQPRSPSLSRFQSVRRARSPASRARR